MVFQSKPGYLKNDLGKCVRPRNCPVTQCKKNEIFECRNPTCEPGCLLKPCMSVNCENKCYCRKGFVRENGVCIPIEKCPIVVPPPTACADPNAEYTTCGSTCNQPRCRSAGLTYMCLEKCEVGCFCKKGFFLDNQGKCVAKCPLAGKYI